jgi:hypothetical protein
MKRAYQEDHQFDEDAMPCICSVCSGWFDLNDGSANPRKQNEVICEGCADDIEKEIEREDEIQELLDQISDAEYTIKESKARLAELNYTPTNP